MFYIKKIKENNAYIWIGYSIEASIACDGVIRYDKISGSLELQKLSDSDDTGIGADMVCEHIHRAIRKNTLDDKLHKIVCW